MPLHQGCDVTVFCATNEIALPMTGDGAVLDFCGPFPDRDGIDDLTARIFKDSRVLRAADAALGSQVPQQLFLQHSAGYTRTKLLTAAVGREIGIYRQLSVTFPLRCWVNILPDHPMGFQVLSAVPSIKPPSGLIGRLDVDADPMSLMGYEPFS